MRIDAEIGRRRVTSSCLRRIIPRRRIFQRVIYEYHSRSFTSLPCVVLNVFKKKWSKTGAPSFDEPVLESPNTPEATKRALFLHWPARTGPWWYRNTACPAPQPRSLLPSRHAPRCKKMVQNRRIVDNDLGQRVSADYFSVQVTTGHASLV